MRCRARACACGVVRPVDVCPRPRRSTVSSQFRIAVAALAASALAALAAHPSLAAAQQAPRDTTPSDSTRRAQALEALTVTATRASADAPVARTTLDKARLQRDY